MPEGPWQELHRTPAPATLRRCASLSCPLAFVRLSSAPSSSRPLPHLIPLSPFSLVCPLPL